jgi:PleD family two-component response regulator
VPDSAGNQTDEEYSSSMRSHSSFTTNDPKYRALVANDDVFQLRIISSLMQQLEFQVTEAENG